MNELKRKTNKICINSNEAISVVSKLDLNDALYILHEIHYPDTRKDICLVKKTLVTMDGSFDVLYLVWKHGTKVESEKVWSTNTYDPPGEQHLAVGYFLEENNKILVKIYFASDLNNKGNGHPGKIYSMTKEKLGLA